MIIAKNEDAESEILGGVMLTQGDRFADICSVLKPDDFYFSEHGAIFEAMVRLDAKHSPIDAVAVWSELGSLGLQDSVKPRGGKEYLRDLAGSAFAFDSTFHVQSVLACSRRRALQGFGRLLVGSLADDHTEFNTEMEKRMVELSGALRDTSTIGVKGALRDFVAELENRAVLAQAGKPIGVRTGFTTVDGFLNGLRPAQLIIIAAGSGMGKTSLAMNIVQHVAAHESEVLIFSLEMDREALAERLVSSESSVDSGRLRTGILDVRHWALVTSAVGRLVELRISINDSSGISISELRAKARQWMMRKAKDAKTRVIVVDYIQLVHASKKHGTREREVAEVSWQLKELARELKCTVLALSQLNRKYTDRADKRPMLSDLRESGAIEQDADVVMLIHREKAEDNPKADPTVAEIIIAKQRSGATGKAILGWNGAQTRFYNKT